MIVFKIKFAKTIKLKHAHEGLKDGTCVAGFCTSLSFSSTLCVILSSSYQSQYKDLFHDYTQQNMSYPITWNEDSPFVLTTLYYIFMGVQQ